MIRSKVILGIALMAVGLMGCGRDNSYIINTNQDVQLISSSENAAYAIKIDTSGNGDNSEALQMAAVNDPSARKDKLKFSDDLVAGSFDEKDFTITLNGVEVSLASDFLDKVDKVGKAREEKSKACLESGYDTDYYYDNDDLVIYTIVDGGKQIVFNIEIHSDKYPTSKGAKVGVTTRDDLYEMYGMPTDHGAAMFSYALKEKEYSLNFNFDGDGKLESIDIVDNSVM